MTEKVKSIYVPLADPKKVTPFLSELSNVVERYRKSLTYNDIFQVIGALAGAAIASMPCVCQNCVEAGGETIITALLETLSENGLRAELRENEPEVTPERTH